MSRIVYVGPTIIGVATHNTTYSTIPDTLLKAAETAPYLKSLCVPVTGLGAALMQLDRKEGAIYIFYKKALLYSAATKGAN